MPPQTSSGGFMSPVQRSIFRGGHDASRSFASPLTSFGAPRGLTTAGARSPGGTLAPSSPFPTLGASSFAEGGRRVPARQAAASRAAAVRSQTASGNRQPALASSPQRPANFLLGGHGAGGSLHGQMRAAGARSPLF